MAERCAVLFDLGNTLVRYWERHEFPGLLCTGIAAVREHGPGEVDDTPAGRIDSSVLKTPTGRARLAKLNSAPARAS